MVVLLISILYNCVFYDLVLLGWVGGSVILLFHRILQGLILCVTIFGTNIAISLQHLLISDFGELEDKLFSPFSSSIWETDKAAYFAQD